MIRLIGVIARSTLMEAAGDGGGGGTPPVNGGTPPANGGTPPANGGTPPANGGTPPVSAAAQLGGQGTGTPPTSGGTPPVSAAAQLGGQGAGNGGQATVPDVDLAKTSDEDYAKLVMPDVEGQQVDRSLITPMAKELREAGIQPSVMAKVSAIYGKVVRAEVAKDEAARAARMEEMARRCLAEVTEEQKKDFAAAYAEHIAKDPALKHLVDHTELGSSPAFVRLIALAGATLRTEKTPPTAAAAGSSQANTDHEVFLRTVPAHLR